MSSPKLKKKQNKKKIEAKREKKTEEGLRPEELSGLKEPSGPKESLGISSMPSGNKKNTEEEFVMVEEEEMMAEHERGHEHGHEHVHEGVQEESELNLMDLFKKWGYQIAYIVLIESENRVTPKFIKAYNGFGYCFYIEMTPEKFVKSYISEEKYYENPAAKGFMMDKNSLITMMECIGCDIHGVIYECSNGLAYYCCSEKSPVPKEHVFLKNPKKLYVHLEEQGQIINMYMSSLEQQQTTEHPNFNCAICYPVVTLDSIFENGRESTDATISCSIRKLRNNKIKKEEYGIREAEQQINELKNSLRTYNEHRMEITLKLEETISRLEEYAAEYMDKELNDTLKQRYEKLFFNLKRRHELVVDLIKTFCIIGCFSKMITWMNEVIYEINQTLEDGDFSKLDKILGKK